MGGKLGPGYRVGRSTMRQKLLDTIITLTEQRDIESLEYWLLASMADLFAARRLVLYKPVSEHRSDRLLKEALMLWHDNESGSLRWSRDGGLAVPRGALLECLESNELVREVRDGLELSHVPVIDQGRILAVLVLSNLSAESVPQHELEGLCRIYRNYLNILYDNAHDQLTGLLNRKTFDKSCHELINSQRSHQRLLAREFHATDKRQLSDHDRPFLAVVDIDHFKHINDENGHLFGDEILLLMARIMSGSVRGNDLLFRFGGEEFVILLEPTPPEQVGGILEKLRERVASHPFPRIGRLTISIGYTGISGSEHITQVIGRADKALYHAKEHGRNAVFSYEQLLEQGMLSRKEIEGSIELF